VYQLIAINLRKSLTYWLVFCWSWFLTAS